MILLCLIATLFSGCVWIVNHPYLNQWLLSKVPVELLNRFISFKKFRLKCHLDIILVLGYAFRTPWILSWLATLWWILLLQLHIFFLSWLLLEEHIYQHHYCNQSLEQKTSTRKSSVIHVKYVLPHPIYSSYNIYGLW